MEHIKRYELWRDNPALDADTRAELLSIANNDNEIIERFHQDLAFGTGGLRGILGAGTNRMNIYTVRRASQGLADYILENTTDGKARGVVVSHDSRRYSRKFALETALIMVQNGIKAYVFEDLRPTPQLSFAIRHLGCIAGVMVTASHNPPEYNGYKAYWSNGGQFVAPQDEDVIAYVNKIDDIAGLKVADEAEAIKSGMLTILDASIDKEYMRLVLAQSLNPACIQKMADDFNIVYTPLNGAGLVPVCRALRDAGFKHIHVVPEQQNPDPNFTTLKYPNPEDPDAFALGVALAKTKNADIIVATDPDADRMGAMVKNKAGEYELLSGNVAGVLLAEYILSQRQAAGCLPPNPAVISTIVSTKLTQQIATAYGAAYYEVLTGFKYIAEKIREWEQSGEHNYVFGFEESFGYLAGNTCRDKDAISAVMLICEIATHYKSRGMTLYDAMDEIYAKYGYYKENIKSITLKGMDGLAKIQETMAKLRKNPPKDVGGVALTDFRDYKGGKVAGFPSSDVLYYVLADGAWFCVRPSGTEPKIKFYMGIKGSNEADAQMRIDALSDAVFDMVGEL
ncbi:MAG: phospho-sugar mutase [Defluviitaleaceae bacterium]|nr:phospho-sugar mutase [Defluviitaleaceae bacterium]